MDVVYNHTGEGGNWGDPNNPGKTLADVVNIYSLRGLDNSSYYVLQNNSGYYEDSNGCGGNLNIANPVAKNMVLDSLKYWTNEMGVDAFRFDLAAVLGNTVQRGGYSFNPNQEDGFLQAVKTSIPGATLIAEPWDNGNDVKGQFPEHWFEWSGEYRDNIRRILNRPESTPLSKFSDAISGLPSLYRNNSTRAINFITCHDGFTLIDLFGYDGKNNMQPGRESEGGNNDNISRKHAKDLQLKLARNAIMTLMLSKGVPMITEGDEMLRTLYGHNNPYNHDKPFNYIDWKLAQTPEGEDMIEFTRRMIQFREKHPALMKLNYYNGHTDPDGTRDVSWIGTDGNPLPDGYFNDTSKHFLGFRIKCTPEDSASSIYGVINKATGSVVDFTLPAPQEGKAWYFVSNTDSVSGNFNFVKQEGQEPHVGRGHRISPMSMMLFIEKDAPPEEPKQKREKAQKAVETQEVIKEEDK